MKANDNVYVIAEEDNVVHEVLQNWGQHLLYYYCLDQRTCMFELI